MFHCFNSFYNYFKTTFNLFSHCIYLRRSNTWHPYSILLVPISGVWEVWNNIDQGPHGEECHFGQKPQVGPWKNLRLESVSSPFSLFLDSDSFLKKIWTTCFCVCHNCWGRNKRYLEQLGCRAVSRYRAFHIVLGMARTRKWVRTYGRIRQCWLNGDIHICIYTLFSLSASGQLLFYFAVSLMTQLWFWRQL